MAESVATGNEAAPEAPATERWWNRPMPERPFWKDALHIFAIFNFAFAYPVLDHIGYDPWFFITERVTPLDMVLLVTALCIVVPAVLAGINALLRVVSDRAGNLFHAFAIAAILIAGAVHTITRRVEPEQLMSFAVAAIALTLLITFLYLFLEPVQWFASFLSISIVVVPLNFLVFTDASTIVFPDRVEPASEPLQEAGSTDIIFIVVDELPTVSLLDANKEIDPERFPGLAELAADSYWFRNATTISDSTRLASTAMVSGVRAEPGSLPRDDEFPDHIFRMLSETHELHVRESATNFCTPVHCEDAALTLAERLDFIQRSALGMNVRQKVVSKSRPDYFREFITDIRNESTTGLHFHHSLYPHSPWWRTAVGSIYTDDLDPQLVPWTIEPVGIHYWQRHLIQTQHLDSLISELIDHLKSVEMYEDSMIVFVADHGVTFTTDYQYRELKEATAADILYVPLIIKLPGQQEGVISDRNVQVIDILPTIADVLDVEIPWEVDGQSAIDESLPEPEQKRAMVHDTGEWMEFGRTIDGLDQSLQRKLDLFGDGTSPDGLYTMGSYPDMVGESLSNLSISGEADLTFSLDDPSKYDEVDTEGAFIPALIEGTLQTRSTPEHPEMHLAIAVNGTIQAVSSTYQEDGETRFAAMVPEHAFISGENEIDLLVLAGNEASPTVTRATID